MPEEFLVSENADSTTPFAALRRFMRERKPLPAPVEHCELCSAVLATEHRHLLNLARHTLVCACNACATLFTAEAAGAGKYRVIPRRYLALPDFHITDEQWDDLLLPVNMVYLFQSTTDKRAVAYYPSPAGATESLLDLAAWNTLVASNPILRDLEPDVEALLINRVQDAREYYLVPIDACYRLVGLMRSSWRGLSGGEAVWTALKDFFAALQARTTIPVLAQHALFVEGTSDVRSEL